jgi:histidinol-phosphate/aromatic aminotransferase/cobyric acid decarboxylase-like protein
VCEAVLARGVLIRPGSNFGMPGYARITTAPVPRMREAARVLAEVIGTIDEE